jgi:uncharacterized protein YecT (DUF1311 family)
MNSSAEPASNAPALVVKRIDNTMNRLTATQYFTNLCGKNTFKMLALLALSLALVACGKQPPGCADSEIATIATEMIRKDTRERMAEFTKHDEGIIDREIKAIQVKFLNAVDEEFNKEAKKRACKGTIEITTGFNGQYQAQTGYTAQVTADGKQVLVEILNVSADTGLLEFRRGIYTNAIQQRFNGLWNGTLKCSGIDGETEGAKGPITRPVSIEFDKSAGMTMQRTTASGGIEKLAGSANLATGEATLNGAGRNSDTDQWVVNYAGRFQDKTMVLNGALTTPDRSVTLRKCRIEVTQGAPLTAEVSSPAPASSPQAQTGSSNATPTSATAPPQTPAPTTQAPTRAVKAGSIKPSFDCAKASTPIENMICGDQKLAELDVALSENYKNINNSDIGDGARSELRQTQRSWSVERNSCKDSACMAATYRKRLDKICDYPVLTGAHPPCIRSEEIK